ncbi:MAG: LLM class flavin-dependent oxidoreductase [Acidimicrobiales bacterium]
MKIRFAVSPGGGSLDPDAYRALVDGLEALGFDTIWLSDIPLGGSIEPVVGLAIAAARTTRLKLGANVVPIGRSPVQLAKQLAQLDQLSAGRLLLMMVPGVGTPAERAALGIDGRDRGVELERAVVSLRERWAVGASRPVQEPLELWFGGLGPRALERAGRLSDGWLGAAMTPAEVAAAVGKIKDAASAAGREIDPEHFGMSIGYARSDPGVAPFEAVRTRRPDVDPRALIPVGAEALHRLLDQYVAAGCSKFVLRPIPAGGGGPGDVDEELEWLAAEVLPLQT